MQSPFFYNVLQGFRDVIARYGLRPAVESDDMVYLVSPTGYALAISNDRDGINIQYLLLRGPDDVRSYNILLAMVQHRGDKIPRAELINPSKTTTDKLKNYALMLERAAPDALAGDTTWLEQVAEPIHVSPSVRRGLYEFLQAALRAPPPLPS